MFFLFKINKVKNKYIVYHVIFATQISLQWKIRINTDSLIINIFTSNLIKKSFS